MRGLRFALRDAMRHPRQLVLAGVGITVGVSLFAFFSALGSGVQRNVVNQMHPVDRVEVHPPLVAGDSAGKAIDGALLESLRGIQHVVGVHPRQKARFQGRVYGGRGILGRDVHTEALFDGMKPDLLRQEMRWREESRVAGEVAGVVKLACVQDEECGLGRGCVEGRCRDVLWADSFRDHGEVIPCTTGKECLSGECASGECTGTRTRVSCADGQTCPLGQSCSEENLCAVLRCRSRAVEGEEQVTWDRGRLVDFCASGPRVGTQACAVQRECPLGTYCASASRTRPEGHCERPIPAAVNPTLVEMFNTAGTAALGLPALAGPEALLGLRFQIRHGDSFFGTRESGERQVERWVEVAGFSDKAMALGVTFPLPYVARANARYRGRERGLHPDSVVLQAESNEFVAGVAREAEAMGLTLSSGSDRARKASRMLWIVTLVFQLIAVLVLLMGLVNVAHVFRLLVQERSKEMGVFRALGASRGQVRGLVLIQSGGMGILAGLFGCGLAWALGQGVDAFLLRGGWLAGSGSFFHWSAAWLWAVPVVAGGCIAGAWAPAREAGELELAEVLSPS